MFKKIDRQMLVSDLSKYLNLVYYGDDIIISEPVHISNLRENKFTFFMKSGEENKLIGHKNCLIICPDTFDISLNSNISYIISEQPKLSFYQIVNEFYIEEVSHNIDPTSFVSTDVNLGININIGRNSIINGNIKIGNNTYIGNNVIISGDVEIGANCYIKDCAVIGSEGFGFLREMDYLIHVPQFGKILLEDDVWLGSNSTIERPSLGTTILKKGVKIDDLVQVGHEVFIDEYSMITAGTIISGRARIGKFCFVGINSSIRQGMIIGDNVFLGAGSVVVKNLESDFTYAGVPTRKIIK